MTTIPFPEVPMPRYKEANYAQGQFVSIQFEHQILPGSFEQRYCQMLWVGFEGAYPIWR